MRQGARAVPQVRCRDQTGFIGPGVTVGECIRAATNLVARSVSARFVDTGCSETAQTLACASAHVP